MAKPRKRQRAALTGRTTGGYTREPYSYKGLALSELMGDGDEIIPSVVPSSETIERLHQIENQYNDLIRQQELETQAQIEDINKRYEELAALENAVALQPPVEEEGEPSPSPIDIEGDVVGMEGFGEGAVSAPVEDEGPFATPSQTGKALGKMGVGVLTGKPVQGLISAIPALAYPTTAKDSPYMNPTMMGLIKDSYKAIKKGIPFSEQVYDTAMENFVEQTMEGIGIENPRMMEEERHYNWGIPPLSMKPFLNITPDELTDQEGGIVYGDEITEDELGIEEMDEITEDELGLEDFYSIDKEVNEEAFEAYDGGGGGGNGGTGGTGQGGHDEDTTDMDSPAFGGEDDGGGGGGK